VPADPPTWQRARALGALARSLIMLAQTPDESAAAATAAADAIEVSRATGSREVEALALASLGLAQSVAGAVRDASSTFGARATWRSHRGRRRGARAWWISSGYDYTADERAWPPRVADALAWARHRAHALGTALLSSARMRFQSVWLGPTGSEARRYGTNGRTFGVNACLALRAPDRSWRPRSAARALDQAATCRLDPSRVRVDHHYRGPSARLALARRRGRGRRLVEVASPGCHGLESGGSLNVCYVLSTAARRADGDSSKARKATA
jgi:hypothetical protein